MEGGDDAEVSEHLRKADSPPPRGFDDSAASRGETDQRRGGGAPVAGTRDHDDSVFHKEAGADQTGRSRVRAAHHLQATASPRGDFQFHTTVQIKLIPYFQGI